MLPACLLQSGGLEGSQTGLTSVFHSPHTLSHLAPSSVEESDLALIQLAHFPQTRRKEKVASPSILEKESSEFTSEQLGLSLTHLAHWL